MAVRYRWDDFTLDTDTYRLERAGVTLSLEPKAFNLLALMVSRPGHLFTKQEIFDAVWPATAVSDHALTRVVAQLRRVLGDEVREARYLETVPTRGYRWIRPVETEQGGHAAQGASVEPLEAAVHDERTTTSPPTVPGRRAAFVAVALLLIVVAGALGHLLLRSRPAPSSSPWETPGSVRAQFPTQITTHTGVDLHPALAPAGDAVAFASDRSGAFEIYVRSFGPGGIDVAITNDGAQNVQPSWSPDGRFVVYHSAARGGIWIIPARGGIARQVVPRGSGPRWSPDGQRIVYQSDEHADIAPTGFGAQIGSTLWLVDVDGGTSEPLTTAGQPAGAHGSPAWSRDGRYVAFAVFDGGDDDGLWVVRVDSRMVSAIDREVRGYEVAFADNDTTLYVAGGEPVIFKLSFDPETGRGRAKGPIVVAGVPGVRGISVSADGRLLTLAGLSLSSHIWAQGIDSAGHPSAAAHALTRDTSRRSYAPAISPDGTKAVYMSARRGEAPNIWIVGVDDQQTLQLTDHAGFERAPSWFPDGRRVAYVSEAEDELTIRSIDEATRREQLIVRADGAPTTVSGRLSELQLSPSMTQMALSMAVAPYGYRRLYVATIEPFTARAVTDGSRSVGYPAWSPDESRIAVQIQDTGSTHLGVIDLATGQLRQITNERGQVWVRSWSPDGRRVAAAVLRNRLWSLEWFDATTGERGVMTPPAPTNVYYRYPEWSPRGDTVVFERGEMRGNIWTLSLPSE